MVQRCVEFILKNTRLETWGTTEYTMTATGKTITMPRLTRLFSKTWMWVNYDAAHPDEVRRSSFLAIVNALAVAELKGRAAVDYTLASLVYDPIAKLGRIAKKHAPDWPREQHFAAVRNFF
jgi:hypothetical protein